MAKAGKPRFRSAAELFEKAGTVDVSHRTFSGMIKPAEDDKSILFARTGDCSKWISLPLEYIDDVDPIRWVHCGEQKYRQVHITMKAPTTPEAGAFADLASFHHAQLSDVGPPGASSCHYDWKHDRIICS